MGQLLRVCILASSFFLSQVSFATVGGSKCGLDDAYESEEFVEFGSTIDLSRMSESQIRELPTLIKQQLIISAKDLSSEAEDAANIDTTMDAVRFLRASSEAEDVYVKNFSFRNSRFTKVLIFPGGNPVGSIFPYGRRSIIAEISDSTIYCK